MPLGCAEAARETTYADSSAASNARRMYMSRERAVRTSTTRHIRPAVPCSLYHTYPMRSLDRHASLTSPLPPDLC